MCVSVQQSLPNRLTRAPMFKTPNGCEVPSGVIVRWRIKGAGTFSMAPVEYEGDGVSDTIVVPRFPGSEQRSVPSGLLVSWFPTRVPIFKDEYVALFMLTGSSIASRDVAGADVDVWGPAPPLGTPTIARGHDRAWEDGWNVVVETDADRDGFGDETQDPSPPQDPCPPPQPPEPPVSTPAPSADTTAPVITAVAFRRQRLRLELSEAARVTISLSRRRKGKFRYVKTSRSHVGRGPAAIRLARRRLRRGRYRVVIRAVDDAGNTSLPVRLRFRVRRR